MTLWIGGLVTWLPLINSMPLQNKDAALTTYLTMKAIAWNVIGWGGITSFVTGLLNALLTTWGIWRHTWVRIKLIGTIGMIILGMFYTEQKMQANIRLLEGGGPETLKAPEFLANHHAIQVIVPIQLVLFFLIVLISVWKPFQRVAVVKNGDAQKLSRITP